MIVLTYILSGHYQTILKLYLEETLTSPALNSGAVVQIFTVSIVRVLNHSVLHSADSSCKLGIERIVLTYMFSGHYQTILKLFLEETLIGPAFSSGSVLQYILGPCYKCSRSA